MVTDLVSTLQDRFDGCRVLLDAPGWYEKGLLEPQPAVGFKNARYTHGGTVPTHADGVKPVVPVIWA
jgi:hypothetical protein